MVLFIRIDKNGSLKEEEISDINILYKSCGLRKPDGFINIYSYNNNNCRIELWGRNNGRSNIKNLFIFPLDTNITLFGSAAIICLSKNKLENLTIENWNKICLDYKKKEINKVEFENSASIESHDDDESDSDDDENDSSSDSELQPEEYIYSSEEDNN
jgi:hypothetical protein